jgi:hypothetical protein
LKRGWGNSSRASLEDLLLRNKTLINENEIVKVYKSFGVLHTEEVILHDGRKSNNKSKAILKDVFGHVKVIDVTHHFKSFKEVFIYIALKFNEGLWRL